MDHTSKQGEGKSENKGYWGKRKGFQYMNFAGKGEMMKLVGRWLVTVTAPNHDRMPIQTLSPCMDCERELFAGDTQAEMPLASPKWG